MPDGRYRYRLASTDPAGNTGPRQPGRHRGQHGADRRFLCRSTFPAFSPNGDGVKDTLHFALNVPVTRGVEKWGLVVVDAAGRTARTFAGPGPVPPTEEFDGRDDNGVRLPEGSYSAATLSSSTRTATCRPPSRRPSRST